MDRFDLRQWKGFEAAGGDPLEPAIIDQIVIDSRLVSSQESLFIALEGKRTNGHLFLEQAETAGAKYALVKPDDARICSKGLTYLYVKNPLTALQEIATAYRNTLPSFVIAIAGSYGKTMTKDLLSHLVSLQFTCGSSPESFNSQIGVPLSILSLNSSHQIALIEAGTSEPGELSILAAIIQPHALIITPLGNRPLHGIETLSHFVSETIPLTHTLCSKRGWLLAPDHQAITPLVEASKAPFAYWNRNHPQLPQLIPENHPFHKQLSYKLTFPDGLTWTGALNSQERYFLDQIQMASKAAWKLGVPSHKIIEGLRTYQPQLMRTEMWRSPEGALIINDAYSSDPQSVEHSLHWLQQNALHYKRYIVFGGLNTEQELAVKYRKIAKMIASRQIDGLFLYGNHAFNALKETLAALSPKTGISQHTDCLEALQALKPLLKPGDSVLIKGAHKEPLDQLLKVLHESSGNNFCYIHLSTIWHNLSLLRRHLPQQTHIMAMVKAQAYGTDAIQMARFLQECQIDILGVSTIEEAVALRLGGITHPLFVIAIHPEEAQKAVSHQVEVGVGDLACIQALEAEAQRQNRCISVHLHLDTGMARFGCRPEQLLELAQKIQASSHLNLKGVMTHLACAEEPQADPFTWHQISSFRQAIQQLEAAGIHPLWRHVANSAGAIRFHLPDCNLVRLGLALYGLSASQEVQQKLPLCLALSLFSRITAINTCRQGESVSYGRAYRVQREEERIAILPIGYFDGLHRIYSNRGVVMIHGQRAPIVGKVCMDFCMVDITDIPNAKVGDPVLIFGEDEAGNDLSPEEFAQRADSIAHELITCLGPRIQRIFLQEESYKTR